MPHLYLATLGQRPEAITIGLDWLREHYPIAAVGIIHTEPTVSGITEALAKLKPILVRDYPALAVSYHELTRPNGAPLIDISDQTSAADYFRAIYRVLLDCKARYDALHLVVAGGRKAMSIYATLAAALVFRQQDRIWTVISPSALLDQSGLFHVPPGWRDQVQLVELPLVPARIALIPETLRDDPLALVAQMQDRRADFLAKLTPQQRRLAELYEQHPDATNAMLGQMLDKSPRTVENQFRAVYNTMIGYLEFGETVQHKRQTLFELLRGHL